MILLNQIEHAKKEFRAISTKTKLIGEEARDIVELFKDNLKHYSRREIGIYAALTVALTVTLKSKRSWRVSSYVNYPILIGLYFCNILKVQTN